MIFDFYFIIGKKTLTMTECVESVIEQKHGKPVIIGCLTILRTPTK